MIGYILLIAFAVVMGGIIYNWMKSYVPKDSLKCPDGVSMFLTNVDCSGSVLNLDFKNNGRFDIAGYFIRGAKEDEEVATIDLSPNVTKDGGIRHVNSLLFGEQGLNTLKPGEEGVGEFNLQTSILDIKMVEIIPIRFQVVNNRNQIVACTEAKIHEFIICSEEEKILECYSDDDCEIEGEVCNTETGECTLCGNGIWDLAQGELCDDNNFLNGDCCSNECQTLDIESGCLQDVNECICP